MKSQKATAGKAINENTPNHKEVDVPYTYGIVNQWIHDALQMATDLQTLKLSPTSQQKLAAEVIDRLQLLSKSFVCSECVLKDITFTIRAEE